MDYQKICFIGGGNMARGLIGGLINDGMKPQFITVSEPDVALREDLTNHFGVTVLSDNVAAVKGSDIVIFAVKPQVMKAAVMQLSEELSEEKHLLFVANVLVSIHLNQLM